MDEITQIDVQTTGTICHHFKSNARCKSANSKYGVEDVKTQDLIINELCLNLTTIYLSVNKHLMLTGY